MMPPPPLSSTNSTNTATAAAAASIATATVTVIYPTPPDASACHRVNYRSSIFRHLSEELLHLFVIIDHIKTIGPIEWEKVEEEYGMAYQDRDIKSICRKYTIVYQKKLPTGNLDCHPKVCLARRYKATIGNKVQLGCGEHRYNMETGEFGGYDEVADGAVKPVKNKEGDRVLSNITTTHSPRCKKPDFSELMMMQMRKDAKARVYERKEKVAYRQQE